MARSAQFQIKGKTSMKLVQKKQSQSLGNGDVGVEERLEKADQRKMEGNTFFKDGKLGEAMQQYEMAITYLGDDFMVGLNDEYLERALALKNPCHLNMAACLLKLKRFEEVIVQCSIVLAKDKNNAKALYRRGKARAELGQVDTAREDLLQARKLAPDDKAISDELRSLVEHDKAVYQKQKELYKGIFGPRIESDDKDDDTLLEETSYSMPKLTKRPSRGKYIESDHDNVYSNHW